MQRTTLPQTCWPCGEIGILVQQHETNEGGAHTYESGKWVDGEMQVGGRTRYGVLTGGLYQTAKEMEHNNGREQVEASEVLTV